MVAPNLRAVDATLPDPPYPAETKSNGWKPEFDVSLIETSETWVLAEDDERPWLLRIWYEAWKSVPVGSMPEDRRMFARRIGCTRKFLDVHAEIFLRGWILHSDGNLYHSHISRQVNAMLDKRVSTRKKVAEWRGKKKQKVGEKCNPPVTGYKPVCNPHVTVCNPPEQEQEQEQEQERRNRHVDLETEKPQNQVAAVERDAPDMCVSDSDSQTKTPERAVFDYWREKMGHPNAKLATKRRNAIKARLKEGYQVADIFLAIDGCKASEWHQGKNDRKTVFDDIELICRDATKLDAFIVKAGEAAKEQGRMDDFLNGTFKSALYPDPTDQSNTIEGEFHAI